ncbi:MAG: hypothetical protein CM1200mP41_33220 [Gammaproteobacteria bacterium]|nr:MAG: hypothetical protein CM1200mP41_33220 [Gammaproteobacteria bacterium]
MEIGEIFCDYGTDGGSLASLFVGIADRLTPMLSGAQVRLFNKKWNKGPGLCLTLKKKGVDQG